MRRLAILSSLVVLAGCGGGDGGDKSTTTSTAGTSGVQLGPAFGSFDSLPGVQKTPPPWSANNGAALKARLEAMGLKPLSQEGAVVHIHQHLDLYVDGKKVTVPPQIGISTAEPFISDLHTHDPSGVIHVESPTASSFSLGQVFGVWGVPLGPDGIGSLKTGGDKLLKTWVNGKEVKADPTRVVLDSHQEIVIAYGTADEMPKDVPSSYDFPNGE